MRPLLMAALVLLASCTPVYAIDEHVTVQRGRINAYFTFSERVFVVASRRIEPCVSRFLLFQGMDTVWSVETANEEICHTISRIEYGRVPQGFTETVPAKPLELGATYLANSFGRSASGGTSGDFTVGE